MGMLTGREPFTEDGKPIGFSVTDFWSFQFSNIDRDPEYVAEFLVAKAIRIDEPSNDWTWTLYDIDYRHKRIEVKETAYWHPFNDAGKVSQRRRFGIPKMKGDGSVPVRQNDLYVFCLLNGETKEEACPLEVAHWEFYVVRTAIINQTCGDQKTVALSRIRELCEPVAFSDLKDAIDREIDVIDGALG